MQIMRIEKKILDTTFSMLYKHVPRFHSYRKKNYAFVCSVDLKLTTTCVCKFTAKLHYIRCSLRAYGALVSGFDFIEFDSFIVSKCSFSVLD